MAEEADGPESGAEAPAAGVDPAAISIALGAAAQNERVAAKAEAYLESQRRLGDLQHDFMLNKELFEVSHLRWRRFSDQMKGALQVLTVLVGLGVFAALCVMVWSAAHSDGLVVESFAVPPELAEKGFSGQAVASRMLDKLTGIQRDTASVLPSRSYANSWGDDLKVEIPETGVSVGEVYRFLRGWLGHETRVSGEIVRTDSGIAVTARVDGADAATYAGPQATLDALLLQSAQNIYRATQPDRYARYLFFNADRGGLARFDEARSILTGMLATGTLLEKASAVHMLGVLDDTQGRAEAAIADYRQALAWNPDSTVTHSNLSGTELLAGHGEAALATAQSCLSMLDRKPVPNLTPNVIPRLRFGCQYRIAMVLGDFAAVTGLAQGWIDAANGASPEGSWGTAAQALAQQHDAAAADAYLAKLPAPTTATNAGQRAITRLQVQAAREDWPSVIAQAPVAEESNFKARHYVAAQIGTVLRPWAAYAQAMAGDFAAAHAVIDTTPGDCDLCLRMRGRIDAAQKNYGGAAFWFARAAQIAPSIPFAYTDWGQVLLSRGDADGAIAKFAIASQKGPHFADPLEGWGEALMAKNRSDLALAKFAAAEKYAPNWGRLHLKWGEALTYAGKKDEAAKHFARAAALDLTPSEKFELKRFSPQPI